VVLVLLPACSGRSEEAAAFDDPFAYCDEVRDIDAPDTRYIGDAVPASIEDAIRLVAGIADDAPSEVVRGGTSWRCMGGDVYACFVGANLPCDAKADTRDQASTAMNDYCAANPNTDVIPAVVTGRETIFAWRCDGEHAVVDHAVFHEDDRGYIAEIWYRLDAPQA